MWNNKRGETPQGEGTEGDGGCGPFFGGRGGGGGGGGLPQEMFENEVL